MSFARDGAEIGPRKTYRPVLMVTLACFLLLGTAFGVLLARRGPAYLPGPTDAQSQRSEIEESAQAMGTDLGLRSGQNCCPDGAAYLGITYLPVTESVAFYYRLEGATGALVTAVAPDSPAARAGLRAEDIILSLDGEGVTPRTGLVSLLMRRKAGEAVRLTVLRGSETKDLEVRLSQRPGN